MPNHPAWPELTYRDHQDTIQTLQLLTQIAGKIRLARTPWLNHSWHVPLYVAVRGLGTGLIPHGGRSFQLEFDFLAHEFTIATTAGECERIALRPRTVADFHAATMRALRELDLPVAIHPQPNEVPDPIRFADDTTHAAYEPDYARDLWRVLVQVDRVLQTFRTGFLGKSSPVHFFWGSFDLAVTRFSGRRAPPHPGGIPHLPDAITREAYSHEVSSAGFWPGGGAVSEPMFYSYAYPTPAGFAAQPVQPAAARFHDQLGEFVLPYSAVRGADDPDAALLAFLNSTYAAAASSGGWDRAELECPLGTLGTPRPA
jgi:Family of unknown function (DUF5996)